MSLFKIQKMKKYRYLTLILWCIPLFIACTQEEQSDESQGGTGSAILPDEEDDDTALSGKKVAKIIADLGDGEQAELYFEYDVQGRLVKISETDDRYGGTDECEIIYSENSLSMRLYDKFEDSAILKDGKAISNERTHLSSGDIYFYDFVYSQDYLSGVFDDSEGSFSLKVEGGNLTHLSGDGEMTFVASKVENKANVDLFYFILGWIVGYDDFWELGFVGALGERFRNLPESISTYEDDPSLCYTYLEAFYYETDADGDVTEIIHRAHEGYNSGETVNSYTETYTIVYSEEASNTPDDEEENQPSIIGTWEYSEEIDNIVATERIEFQSDLTGSVTYTEMDEWGEVLYSEGSKFEYSLSTDSEGITYVIIVEEEVSTRYRYDITATRLLLFIDDNSYIEFQKQ